VGWDRRQLPLQVVEEEEFTRGTPMRSLVVLRLLSITNLQQSLSMQQVVHRFGLPKKNQNLKASRTPRPVHFFKLKFDQ
jgi:hypothetical protein